MGHKIITLSGAATDVLYALFSVARCCLVICLLNLAQPNCASLVLLKPDTQQLNTRKKITLPF